MFRETFSPDAPPPSDALDATPGCAIVPRYRERPRISLRRGTIVAHSIQLSPGTPAAVALDLACGLSHATGFTVSVPVAGPVAAVPGRVADALARTGLPPGRLEVALAGTALARPDPEALLALATLRDQGVGLALSDFGEGTLDLVERLPLSTLILAPGLLVDIPGDGGATTVLHALMRLAKRHGVGVVATGIESEGQRALLSGLGCAEGEGPMFGPVTLRRADRRRLAGMAERSLAAQPRIGKPAPMNAPADHRPPPPDRIEDSILRLAAARGPDKSICPSEVARDLIPGPQQDGWQSLMTPVRNAAIRLARAGRIDILRKGRPVAFEPAPDSPHPLRGVIRLRIKEAS